MAMGNHLRQTDLSWIKKPNKRPVAHHSQTERIKRALIPLTGQDLNHADAESIG